MPLEKIELLNFQRFPRLVLKLDEACTSLVGDNDAGKSTVLRALRWLALNQPAGDSFVRRVGDEKQYPCVVRVTVRDGDHRVDISRHRTGDGNWYEVGGTRYAAVGRDVPREVSRLLKVSELNFRGQHDAVFWFSDTAGQVSKALNKIVNLDVIDSSLAAAASKLRGTKSEVEVSRRRLDKATADRDALAWVADYDAALQRVEALQADRDETARRATELRILVTAARGHARVQRTATLAAQSGKKLLLIGRQARELAAKATQLRKLTTEYRRLLKIAKRPGAALPPPPPEPDPRIPDLRTSIEEYRSWKKEYDRASRAADELRNELSKLTRSGCPLCGSPVSG